MIYNIKTLFLVFILTLLGYNCNDSGDKRVWDSYKGVIVSGNIEINDMKLPYAIEGTGTPCIVIAFKTAYQRGFSSKLRNHFKLIFVDFPWSMADTTSVNPNNFNLDTILDYIDKVRIAFNHEEIAVLGHSMHGLVALEYARKYPQCTSHVIAVCPPYPNSKSTELIAKFWESDASRERKAVFESLQVKLSNEVTSELSASEIWIKGYVARGPKFWFNPSYDCSWILKGSEINQGLLNKLGSIFKGYNIDKLPGKIDIPVFLALGRYDYICPYVIWEGEKEKLPNLYYRLFEKSGHWPMLEEQETFDSELIGWLEN